MHNKKHITNMYLLRNGLRLAKIFIGARSRRWVLSGPLYVQVGPSDQCNYRCVMCWDHGIYSKKKEDQHKKDTLTLHTSGYSSEKTLKKVLLPLSIFEGLVQDLIRMGTYRIKLTGRGEPLLHPQWIEMIHLTKSKGMRCALTTNGSLLKEEDAKSLVEIGLDELEISLNAISDSVYKKIHPGANGEVLERIISWNRLLDRIKKNKGLAQPHIILSFVILRPNYHEIPDLASLAYRFGFNEIALRRVSFPDKCTTFRLKEGDTDHLRSMLIKGRIEAKKYGIKSNIDEILRWGPSLTERSFEEARLLKKTPCYVGWYFCQIQADGTVYPCCQCSMPLGDLNKETFYNIWYGTSYNNFRKILIKTGQTQERKVLESCMCSECGFLRHNLSICRFLTPKMITDRAGLRTWSMNELKRF